MRDTKICKNRRKLRAESQQLRSFKSEFVEAEKCKEKG